MNYYILNINIHGENKVDDWISGQNIAPIFYRELTLTDIRDGVKKDISERAFKDAKLFFDTFTEFNKDAIIFSIGNENVYLFKQEGDLKEYEEYKKEEYKKIALKCDLVKGFRIELIGSKKIKDCPLVLASSKLNRGLSAGTFKFLSPDKHIGNIKAIEYLLPTNENKRVKVENWETYLKCLSSLEFETLIAKYLEEKGLFVPAYKGGYIRNFDLFCKNISDNKIRLTEGFELNRNDTCSIQVKLSLTNKDLDSTPDLYFCINTTIKGKNIFDKSFLHKELDRTPKTKKWLGEIVNT